MEEIKHRVRAGQHIALLLPSKKLLGRFTHYESVLRRPAICCNGVWYWTPNTTYVCEHDVKLDFVRLQLKPLLKSIKIAMLEGVQTSPNEETKVIPITVLCDDPDFDPKVRTMEAEVKRMFGLIGGFVQRENCRFTKTGRILHFEIIGTLSNLFDFVEMGNDSFMLISHYRCTNNPWSWCYWAIFEPTIKTQQQLVEFIRTQSLQSRLSFILEQQKQYPQPTRYCCRDSCANYAGYGKRECDDHDIAFVCNTCEIALHEPLAIFSRSAMFRHISLYSR